MMSDSQRELIRSHGARVDALAEKFLNRSDSDLYGMMRYFMGYAEADFQKSVRAAGKRFRPALLLTIAESYGLDEAALPAALSIELFHNCTLIHDDIIDHDEVRRGRPTVWKLWGVDRAINTGDAQLILALLALEEPPLPALGSAATLRRNFLEKYLEVAEGQHLDFVLAAALLGDPLVTEAAYLTMIQKKTAALIRASAEAAPILAQKDPEEVETLGDFGENLGVAYQLRDDLYGIWGTPEQTGKQSAGDIREHKKTLPCIYADTHLLPHEARRLRELYGREVVDPEAVDEILALLMKADAQSALEKKICHYKGKALDALERTKLRPSIRNTLTEMTHTLIPEKW